MTTRPRARRWTTEDLAQLRRLAATTPIQELARALGRTVVAVRTKAAHERLPLAPDVPSSGPTRARAPWDRRPDG